MVEYKATKEAPLLGIDVLPLLYIRLPTTKPTTLPNFEKKTNNLILLAAAVSFKD